MYSNDGNNKIIIERKKNLFTKIFAPRSKRINNKKDIGIKYIVSYPSDHSISWKQNSQSSIVNSINSNSLSGISQDEKMEIIACQNPSNKILSNTNSIDELSYVTTDPITERKTNTTSQKTSSNKNKESKSNTYYVNSMVVYKSTKSHECFKNYLKSLAHARKNAKTYISVTSTTPISNINGNTPSNSKHTSLPNISSISNVSSTFSIGNSSSQISQTQLCITDTTSQNSYPSKEKKEDASIMKSRTDRKLALDKIITKLRKVQHQQNQQYKTNEIKYEQENIDKKTGKVYDRPTKSKSKTNQSEIIKSNNININKYFNDDGKGKASKYINQNQSKSNGKYMKINPAKINNFTPTISYSTKGHEMIPRHKNISVHSNYNKIASIDVSNNQPNDEKLNPINQSSSTQHMHNLSHNITSSTSSNFEMTFNSDDTLINSQFLNNSQINAADSNMTIVKSNSSISNTQEQLKELESCLNDLNLDKSNSNTPTNLDNNKILSAKTSSNSNLMESSSSSRTYSNVNLQNTNKSKSLSRTHSNGNIQPTATSKSIEFRIPKGNSHTPNNLNKCSSREFCKSQDTFEMNLCGSPASNGSHSMTKSSYYYEPSISGKSDKGSRSISVSFAINPKKTHRNRYMGAFSLKNYVTTETIEENSDEESSYWNENFEVENDSNGIDFSRKPKSLCNESVFSYSSSVNQIRHDLKMEKYQNKKKYFANLLSKDRDIYLREKLRKKIEELDIESDTKKSINNRRISNSTSHSIKETDSIYIKTEEPNNVSLPSLQCMTKGKVNQYHFIKEIDSGSYGHVYMVFDENINKYFACKVISKSRLKRNFRFTQVARRRNISPMSNGSNMPEEDPLDQIKREVAIFKKMTKHPNIASLVEVLDDAKEDNIYMVFELCEKGKIMNIKVNERVEPFTEERARKYFRDIVLGLEYCHYKKIIHRDIKPENLLLTANDTVKITDFGISYMFNENQDDANLFDKNASPLFCPPEACSTERKCMKGKAVDIWALGATLYSFVHGHCPFEDDNIINLCKKIEEDPVVYSPTISDELKDLLSKMLQKDPDKRITLPEIKEHCWVTENGTNPMMSTEENCIYEEINDDEIQNAIQPAFMFVSKLLSKLKKGIKKNEKHKNYPLRHHSINISTNSLSDHKQWSYSQSPNF